MTLTQILNDYKKGTFTVLKTSREAKVKKSCEDSIIKQTTYSGVRFGLTYDNLAQTQRKREEGELPQENTGLPWGEWKVYPFLITHNGKDYLRFYAQKDKIHTTWYRNGKEVSKRDIMEDLLSSEKPKPTEDTQLILTINIENIVA